MKQFAVINNEYKCAGVTKRKALWDEIYAMSDEELQQVQLEKQPNGCATGRAIAAAREIYQRSIYGKCRF